MEPLDHNRRANLICSASLGSIKVSAYADAQSLMNGLRSSEGIPAPNIYISNSIAGIKLTTSRQDKRLFRLKRARSGPHYLES